MRQPLQTPTTIAEIVQFHLIEGTQPVQFLAAAEGTEALVKTQPGFLARYLMQGEDGSWTDLVFWSDIMAAQAAAATVVKDPAFAPFMALIDGATVKMRHDRVIWSLAD
ncbi:hypothetical protein D2N39_02855 [Gemmobacter lutimaris]|uniref:ABM domain-containing protein n=1 Tax=Gemmobacter lutimaris TaxID=2306023 RepID=A0A398C0R8_9RHOB|nr:hypothetical protein [Gemmobacter lutimaris]RID93850.1 hypothetical protein D2N39_02855 [Gemmobacter lutimaris]